MLSMGFNNSIIQAILNEEEEEGNNQSTHVHDASDLETILSTNDFYKKKGKGPNERSTQCLFVTTKTTTSRSIAPTTHPFRNISNNS